MGFRAGPRNLRLTQEEASGEIHWPLVSFADCLPGRRVGWPSGFGRWRGRRVLGKILGERCLRCKVLDAPTNLSVGFAAVLDTVNGDGPGSVVNVVEHPVDAHP
jgi:hypothetical protein